MIKKIIIISLVIAITVSLVIIIKAINFGALTVSLIEHAAKVEISYQHLKGNLLTGFHIEDYCVRISPDDSIFGATADINYRFRPLGFRLPSLFEITLIEPTLTLKQKQTRGRTPGLRIPTLTLGLRIIVKNGAVQYQNDTHYNFTGISGLVFIDLVSDHMYINTVNLAFQSEEFPLKITSTNADLKITRENIEARSLRIKGSGLLIAGKGSYSLESKTGQMRIADSHLDLGQFDGSGSLDFKGLIDYQNGKVLPKVQGKATGIKPFDRFAFETNTSGDTIIVNLFDGELLEGTAFAQIIYLDENNWKMEANFKHLNVNRYLAVDQPLIINGFVVYRQKKFIAFINSPADSGINVDSLYLYGGLDQSALNIDSGYIADESRSLQFAGDIGPDFDVQLQFSEFELNHLVRLLPLNGRINGSCRVTGSMGNIDRTNFTSSLYIDDFAYQALTVDRIEITGSDFSYHLFNNELAVKATGMSYRRVIVDTINLTILNSQFSLMSSSPNGTLKMKGPINQDKKGNIDEFIMKYNEIETSNDGPIAFDLEKLTIDDFRLFFLNGILEGNIQERKLTLNNGHLDDLGKFIGLEEPIQGTINLIFINDSIRIEGREISFRGLDQGSLYCLGKMTTKRIDINLLKINDALQELEADGYWVHNHIEINARLKDVGIWPLFFLENIFKDPSGTMNGRVSFAGNLEKFKFTGAGTVTLGSFTIEAIDARIDSAEGNVRFENNRIFFDQVKGQLSTRNRLPLPTNSGTATGGGIINLEPKLKVRNLNFDFNFIDAPIQFQPYAFGIGSGNFTVSLIDNIAHYNGNINVKQGTVPIDFGMRVKVERPVNEENWRMNIRIKGERNIWLRNRETDIEFGGELFVIKEQGAPYLSGTMETHRGNFYWLNHVLSITEGQLTFIPEDKIDPELDVWAEMDTREGVTIILHCYGPISEPVFEFFSDPPDYTEQDIVTYLNLNLSWRELESLKQGEYVGSVLPNALVSWLESDVSRHIRRYTGLDYFRIETPLFEPESKTKVTVGKYISKDLFITYTYDITSFSNMFNVEYFIDDKNEIIIKRDDEGEFSLQYQYRIRF